MVSERTLLHTHPEPVAALPLQGINTNFTAVAVDERGVPYLPMSLRIACAI